MNNENKLKRTYSGFEMELDLTGMSKAQRIEAIEQFEVDYKQLTNVLDRHGFGVH